MKLAFSTDYWKGYTWAEYCALAKEMQFSGIEIHDIDLDYIKHITTEDIYDFLMYADHIRGNMAAAKSRKLSAIKGFFKYFHVISSIFAHTKDTISSRRKRSWIPRTPALTVNCSTKRQDVSKYVGNFFFIPMGEQPPRI